MKRVRRWFGQLGQLGPIGIVIGMLIAAAAVGFYLRERRRPMRPRTRRIAFAPLAFDRRHAPATIRVLRAKLAYQRGFCVDQYNGLCIQELTLERYLRGVVLAEEGVFLRFAGSNGRIDGASLARVAEAWKLQAIAARSYALYAVLVDKYDRKRNGFDLTDTPRDQAYDDRRHPAVDRAVLSTAGRVLVDRRGRLLYAEYSASCHSRGTRSLLGNRRIECHRRCRDHAFAGSSHFRGMCQWGSLHFALDGRPLAWLLAHYYPSATTERVVYRPSVPTPGARTTGVDPRRKAR
ncbi:MAG: SpoIID/LytB domain-containing protein [Myxococcales bacterium]|nr:SpoIID/LytB domain-containing protein [Myxococcales bacterium]